MHLSRASAQAVANRGVFAALGPPADANGSQIGDAFGYGGLASVGSNGYASGVVAHAGTGSGWGGGQTESRHAAPAIDPNGRFATTYRPGNGDLTALESTLADGHVPASARELVSALGARYVPELAAPAQGALAFRIDPERTALPPAGGALHVRIALRSSATAPTARPHMSVHLVMDTSGSMDGASITNARAAARALVQRLEPSDTFSLTRFSDSSEVLIHAVRVGPNRARILSAIDGLHADGGTNLFDGLRAGYGEASRASDGADTVKLVMLVSDGVATDGDTNRDDIAALAAQAFQSSVQTSTVGVGTEYDGPLMSTVADRGAGGYYYVRDSAQITRALTTEFDSRLQPVAEAVEVRVRLRSDVALTDTYGSRRLSESESAGVRAQELAIDHHASTREHIAANRQVDHEGGMRFFVPVFARNDSHVMLLGLRFAAGRGDRPIGTLEVRYKDRLLARNVTHEFPLRVSYGDSDAASLATLDASVARTVEGFDAGETLVNAARDVENNERPQAVALLTERETMLQSASTRLNDPTLNADAGRLARFRALIQGNDAINEPLVLALLLDESARAYMR